MTIETVTIRRRLPVLAIVKRSYGYVWDHRRLLAVPLFLAFLVQLCCTLYIRNIQIAAGVIGHGIIWKIYATSFVAIVFSMSVIVGIHRTVLLDETRQGVSFLRWDANLLRYIGTWLLLAVIGILFIVIASIAGGIIAAIAGGLISGAAKPPPVAGIAIITVLTIIPIMGLFLRFMLALPSAAVGDRDRLGVSWTATRGNWFRLVAIVFLTALPFILLEIVLSIPAIHQIRQAMKGVVVIQQRSVAPIILSSIIRAIDLAVLTVMLSLCYDVLVRGGGPVAAEPI